MTITITNDHGTFAGETEKEALALARKAAKAAREKSRLDEANGKIAYLRAESAGFRIMSRMASGEGFPRGWNYHRAGEQYVPWSITYRDSYSYGSVPVVTWHGEHGSAVSSDHYGYAFLGAIVNGAGFPLCVFLESRGADSGAIEAYAIGIEADQFAFVLLPNVSIDQFTPSSRINE